jgi:4-amino-4-deoxy-L-arabinose transferase-like glycosyltransferase
MMKEKSRIVKLFLKPDPFLVFMLLVCSIAIGFALTPLSLVVSVGEFISPLNSIQNKTLLLFKALKVLLPILSLLGIFWLLMPDNVAFKVFVWLNWLATSKWIMPAILVFAFGLRLIWIFYYPTQLYADSTWYFEKGVEIYLGHGYVYDLESMRPTAAWPVGYPAFLAFLFIFTGPSEMVAKLANVILSLMTIYLTYVYGSLVFNRMIGVASAFLLAILPGYIVYSNLVSTDVLFTFLTTMTLVLSLESIGNIFQNGRHHKMFGLITGLVNGAAAMVRSTGLLLFPLWIFTRWLIGRENRNSLRIWMGSFIIGTIFVVIPWTIRNYLEFQELIPISTNGGFNFWMGNNPYAYGGYIATNNPEINPLIPIINDEFAVEKTGYALGFEFIRQNPIKVIKLIPPKIFYLFNSNDHGLVWNSLSAVNLSQRGTGYRAYMLTNLIYTIIGLIALIGLIVIILKNRTKKLILMWLGAIITVYWTVLHLPFFGLDRFAMPLLPILTTYAALGLYSFIRRHVEI